MKKFVLGQVLAGAAVGVLVLSGASPASASSGSDYPSIEILDLLDAVAPEIASDVAAGDSSVTADGAAVAAITADTLTPTSDVGSFALKAPAVSRRSQPASPPTHQLALLESNRLKRVSIDPATGDVTAVQTMISAELQSEFSTAKSGAVQTFSVGTNCSLNATPCWYGVPPAVSYSFSSGVTSGTWSNRKNFWTGTNFFAKLCWLDAFGGPFPATTCMPERNGTNAWIELGYAVTGTKVDVGITRNG